MAPVIRVSPLIRATFGIALAAIAVGGLVSILSAVGRTAGRPEITDFHAFYIVGQLVWSGQFAQAYHAAAMLALEQALGGKAIFMPWSYPPLFGIVVAALAAFPLGVAFVGFTAASLALYLWATARLDADGRWPVMLASIFSIALNLRCGQNGLLTAGIVAAAAAFLLDQKPARSGALLALMTIKPHLIPLLPVALVVRRRRTALAVAAAGALALTGLSVAVCGPKVFAAFVDALPNVGRLMAMGAYPLHRMTSIFAFCISVGLPVLAATAIHGAVAIGAMLAAGRLMKGQPDPRQQLGLAILAGLFVSPYVYDYDMVLFGVGLILVSPALLRCVSARHYCAILIATTISQSLGLLICVLIPASEDLPRTQQPDFIFSPMGPAMLAVFCCILHPLWTRGAASSLAAEAPKVRPGAYAQAKAA